MRFTPKTQDQLDKEGLLTDGKYPFTIKEVEEKKDKKGNPFFKLKLFVHDEERDWHIYDNVSMVWFAHKFLHLCYTTGLAVQYESGNIEGRDLLDRTGYCEVAIEESQKGYPAKNVVNDYVTAQEIRHEEPKVKKTPDKVVREADDDVSF